MYDYAHQGVALYVDGVYKARLFFGDSSEWDVTHTINSSYNVRMYWTEGNPGWLSVYINGQAVPDVYRGLTSEQLRLDVEAIWETTYYIYADKIIAKAS